MSEAEGLRQLAEELREFTAMKYAGDCKCGKCQLVPRALVERIYHTLNSTARHAQRAAFAWLIEKEFGSVLHYYAPTEPGEWTPDHLKACRFDRKQDAEAIQFRHVARGHLPERGTRVCEHGWMDHPAVTSTERVYLGTDLAALADRIVGIQEDLPDENDRNALGEAAHYLRKAARSAAASRAPVAISVMTPGRDL